MLVKCCTQKKRTFFEKVSYASDFCIVHFQLDKFVIATLT